MGFTFADFFATAVALYGAHLLVRGLRSLATPPPAFRPSPEKLSALVPPPAKVPAQAPAAPVPAPAPVAAPVPPAPAAAPVPPAPSATSRPVRRTVPVPRDPRRRARPLTWRSLADAPVGFDCALTSGDAELARGNLTTAARCYADALHRARRQRGDASPYFRTEAELRILTLAGICLTPPLALRPATEGERWATLHELARLGVLADCQPAIVHLGSMLYRARRNRQTLSAEGRAAWDLLMACRGLPPEALQYLDDRLLGEGLWGLRPRLAMHRDATRDLWLAMLQTARTPDLVSTIWEIEGAAEDEEVKAALKGGG